MKKLIICLKKWNKAYPEYMGMLQISFYDDESGAIISMSFRGKKEIFGFHNFQTLFSTDPKIYKKGNF